MHRPPSRIAGHSTPSARSARFASARFDAERWRVGRWGRAKRLLAGMLVALPLIGLFTGCGNDPGGAVGPGRSYRSDKRAQPESLPAALVTPEWVATQIKAGAIRVLDLPYREAAYNSKHIPTAQYVDWREDIVDPQFPDHYQLPSRQQMEALMSRLGLTPGSVIVVTDDFESRLATRMYLTLKYFGHDNVFVLDGGNHWFERMGNSMTKEVPEFPTTDYKVSRTREEYLIHLDLLKEVVDTRAAKLVDSRPLMQYSGERVGRIFHTRVPHPRRGHIPGAINVPWTSNLDDDGRFKPVDELKSLYRQRGIGPNDSCVVYCNEGLHATMTWFVLRELLGNSNVRLYDESLAEWAWRDDTPLVEGLSPDQ